MLCNHSDVSWVKPFNSVGTVPDKRFWSTRNLVRVLDKSANSVGMVPWRVLRLALK